VGGLGEKREMWGLTPPLSVHLPSFPPPSLELLVAFHHQHLPLRRQVLGVEGVKRVAYIGTLLPGTGGPIPLGSPHSPQLESGVWGPECGISYVCKGAQP
jgi:hypothetical protein